jgi:hypothetical protein
VVEDGLVPDETYDVEVDAYPVLAEDIVVAEDEVPALPV